MIVICTAHDAAYQPMADITIDTVAAYANKHNYRLCYRPNLDPREGDMCKIRLFREIYATGMYTGDDYFVWIDTDAIVMNSNVKIESIAGQYMGDYHVLYGQDPNGINTGVWMARFTSHADHFLRVSMQQSLAMGWSDQPGIFQTSLQPIFSRVVKYIPGKIFNAMPYEHYGWDSWAHKNEINNYETGDFILHLPGIELQARLELLRRYSTSCE